MRCEFSETQFAHGIVTELTNKYLAPKKSWGPPLFPTQYKEKSLGYDVSIDGPVKALFLQFKVPEKLTRSNAHYWSDHKTSYYEIKIWPENTSPQHNKLRELAKKDSRNAVYYCAPAFIKQSEFDKYYKGETIAKNSVYIPCGFLPQNSGDDIHTISYTLNPVYFKWHSKSEEISGSDLQRLTASFRNVKPYENIKQCLNIISDYFLIDMKDCETDREKYDKISKTLLAEYNLNFILLSDELRKIRIKLKI